MSTQDDERKEPPFPQPLSSAQIADALKRSSDAGSTVILSKLRISDIGAVEITELANAGKHFRQETGSIVERIALASNRLYQLPQEFVLLTKLRYLNLKHNAFSVFPDVLTQIPSLDTLDLSYNKIQALPPRPGTLVGLQIFCLSRNKLKRIPPYISQFLDLEAFQVDRNPIEWPPKAIITYPNPLADGHNMKEWIRGLQNWIDEETSKVRKFDDSGYAERLEWEDDVIKSPADSWRFPARNNSFDAIATSHARSFSIDSNLSRTSLTARGYPTSETSEQGPKFTEKYASTPPSSTVQEDFYTESPASSSRYDDVSELESSHSRAMSHGNGFQRRKRSPVIGKKSLPELRTNHKASTIAGYDLVERDLASSLSNANRTPDDHAFTTVISGDDAGPSSLMPYPITPLTYDIPDARVFPFVAAERNAYLHRSSTITMHESVPRSLLSLLECARSILFATGQLFQTLEHYSMQGGHERMPSIFKKVLDPANMHMLHLIRSLDRFDDVSQTSIPSSAVCRGLAESCRDTITSFRKAVALLIMQLDLNKANRDARYTRWMVLELYAITTELSCAWQVMSPEMEFLRPFLYGNNFTGHSFFSSISSSHSEGSSAGVRLRPIEPSTGIKRARTARRHAGSFSSKDVEIGKELPSYDHIPNISGGLATHTPTLRTPKRQATVPILTTSTPNSSTFSYNSSTYLNKNGQHYRHASQSSFLDSSSILSPALPLDSPTFNTAVVSSEVFNALQNTADIAPIVWDEIDSSLTSIMETSDDIRSMLRDALKNARSSTKKLSNHVLDTSEGYEVDRKVLKDDVAFFLKSIVQLSNMLKSHGFLHSASATVKSNMVKLSNCSEELAILLYISSNASTSSQASHSTSPTSHFKPAPHNASLSSRMRDNQLGSSLSRSKSAQPSFSDIKESLSLPYDAAHLGGVAPLAVKPTSTKKIRLAHASIDSGNGPE